MTRCQTCFNHERFCTCHRLTAQQSAAHALRAAWVSTVVANGRQQPPMLPIDLKFQRIAVAAFN